jgi:nudix-type nucleoside diphosphatase (YffH/AdpP family)
VSDSHHDRVRNHSIEVLSDNWYTLRKATFDYRRSDGSWKQQSREAYDRGNGAVILLYNRAQRTVVLTRQFRYPAWSNGLTDGMLIEACAGLLDTDDPETCIRREAEEETGYRLGEVTEIFSAFMSPGSVTERLHFFVAEYGADDRISEGGGVDDGNEDIEVLEVGFEKALSMIATGEIQDAKTIMLLLHASVHKLLD